MLLKYLTGVLRRYWNKVFIILVILTRCCVRQNSMICEEVSAAIIVPFNSFSNTIGTSITS